MKREPSHINPAPYTVITTATGAALSRRCNNWLPRRPEVTMTLPPSPPFHSWFLSFPLTFWGWFTVASGGLKNYYPGCLCVSEEQVKAKDWRRVLWRVEALLTTCHPSNLVPSSTTLIQRQSNIKSKLMDDTPGENEKYMFCFILSTLSGFFKSRNDV